MACILAWQQWEGSGQQQRWEYHFGNQGGVQVRGVEKEWTWGTVMLQVQEVKSFSKLQDPNRSLHFGLKQGIHQGSMEMIGYSKYNII